MGESDTEPLVKALVQSLPDTVLLIDRSGRIEQHRSAAVRLSVEPVVGMSLQDCFPTDTAHRLCELMQAASATGSVQALMYEQGTADALQVHEARIIPQSGGSALLVLQNISGRRRAEAAVRRHPCHDPLTGLANRELFERELRRAIRGSLRRSNGVAVMFVDLDHFKRINDTLGHAVGDELLQAAARRLESSMRPTDTIARRDLVSSNGSEAARGSVSRLGGDEFVIVLTELNDRAQAASVATRVRHALAEPFNAGGHQFVITPSIGIAIYPTDGTCSEELLLKADRAMYAAKAQGRNRHAFYTESMTAPLLTRRDLEADLRAALANGGFELHYQPKVHLQSGTIVGLEALLRWPHPHSGWIPPSTFIPLAEETGMMSSLGDWVIEAVCQQVKQWQECGVLAGVPVAVNVSAQQFVRDDFVDSLLAAIARHGVDPQSLELEFTEGVLSRDPAQVVAALRRLRHAGLHLAIDDFGAGYCSLGYLRQFPIDALKIDRSFIKDLLVSSDDAAVCCAIIAMARELNLATVAEGVERFDQLDYLRAQGCTQAQGLVFSDALTPTDLEALFGDKEFSVAVVTGNVRSGSTQRNVQAKRRLTGPYPPRSFGPGKSVAAGG